MTPQTMSVASPAGTFRRALTCATCAIVHSGVGATGPSDRRVRAEHLANRPEKHPGHGAVGVALSLPPSIARAVVLDREFPGRHPRNLSEAGTEYAAQKKTADQGLLSDFRYGCRAPSRPPASGHRPRLR